MEWGKQEFRPRTLCEARGCHNRSAPKEPWGAKAVSLLRGLSRYAHVRTSHPTARWFASFLQSFFLQIKKKVESYETARNTERKNYGFFKKVNH